MKFPLIKIAALAVLSMTLFTNSARAETLRVGMECTYAPFNFKNADGYLDGYDVDVAKGVAGIIGADLDFICQKWDGMIPALLANKFDIVVASMSITDKRLKKMDFSDTYRISVGRLVGKKMQASIFSIARISRFQPTSPASRSDWRGLRPTPTGSKTNFPELTWFYTIPTRHCISTW
jgi:membrane-bound lytic murein transglycosylase MltF